MTMVMGLAGKSCADTQLAAPRSNAPTTVQSLACKERAGMNVEFMVKVLLNLMKKMFCFMPVGAV
jgi:hypothetical protein